MTRSSAVADAIAEAARWRLRALVLERPRPGWLGEIRALAREVADPVARAVAEAAADASEGEYLRLLGPGGSVSPREVGYCGFRDPGWVLADVSRYYEAFGYAPRTEDPVDHVAVEAGFVAYLHLKEAAALAGGAAEAVEVTLAARDAFLHEHLATLARPLAARLEPAEVGYLAGAAALLAAHVPASAMPAVGERDVDPIADGCGACEPSGPRRP